MHLRIRLLPSKGPNEPPEYCTEKVFLRDGNHLNCPPLRSGEVVDVPDGEAAALLAATNGILEPTDDPVTRELVDITWEPSPLAKNAPQPDSESVTPSQKGELTKLRNRAAEQDEKIAKLVEAVEQLTAAQAASPPATGLTPEAFAGLHDLGEGDE